jgi:ribosomal protein S18 acetylase RimI-like enzyme
VVPRLDPLSPEGLVIRLRAFRNGDPPALADLWNRALPDRAVVRPLGPHEFDTLVLCRVEFDREGLIVAEEGDRLVGFAHAGFGPTSPMGPPHQIDGVLGTIAMIVVEPERAESDLSHDLLIEAEGYLRRRGAQVIYAGGQYPLNPYYWGIYGGSECAGIMESHTAFRRAVTSAGYEPASTTILLDLELNRVEIRDPKAPIIRRQARLEVVEDAPPVDWWEAEAIGHAQLLRFRLLSKVDDSEVAHASAWDMAAFGRIDGRARTGLYDLEVAPEHRRKGFGRHLVAEILRHVKAEWGEVVSVQTRSTNEPALRLYQSMGFEPVETTVLYRRPGSRDPDRHMACPDGASRAR